MTAATSPPGLGNETTIVVPTMGRPSLDALLDRLEENAAGTAATLPVVLVDDRPGTDDADLAARAALERPHLDVRVLTGGGRGPAHARNLGWRASTTAWVSFLDDDVLPDRTWLELLAADLHAAGPEVGASQANLRVPLPHDRRPTDWERCTAGLETSQWITADLSCRRSVLAAVGGFDERFPRAYREDADLGLRISARWRIERGRRWVTHPVRPADDWVSVPTQAGNADDVLMRRLHGPGWRHRAGAPAGRRTRHLLTAGSGLAAVGGLLSGRRGAAAGLAAAWLAGTTEFFLTRALPGPRDREELRRMAITSAVIPFAASWHTVRGLLGHRHPAPWRGLPELVLFDRDGTLVDDVPYNGDPEAVHPVPGARRALDRLRSAGVRVGLVTNQSGVARGLIGEGDVHRVNARVEELLGPFATVQACLHGPADGCSCRKPEPGMVKAACHEVGVDADRCVLVGDIGSDVAAAESAGATGLLVPTPVTRPQEVEAAVHVAADLVEATDRILAGRW
jgi:histidinol-phosphate phosphatase family protein